MSTMLCLCWKRLVCAGNELFMSDPYCAHESGAWPDGRHNQGGPTGVHAYIGFGPAYTSPDELHCEVKTEQYETRSRGKEKERNGREQGCRNKHICR